MTTVTPSRSTTAAPRTIATATQGSTLADILERVLDKGIVIAGDISVSVGSTELLSIRIRLLVASVDKAREMGINWWEGDPFLSHQVASPSWQALQAENQQLQQRLASLESQLKALQQASGTPLPAVQATEDAIAESQATSPPESGQ